MAQQWDHIDTTAREWIYEASERIRASFANKLTITSKSNKDDLVTNIDQETEKFFIHNISTTFPNHKVLGEEGFGDSLSTLDGTVWIIDPIDGTMNFVHQQRNFMISIGVYHNGVGMLGYIYDVIHNELFSAQKGKGAFLNDQKLKLLCDVNLSESIIGMNATWVMSRQDGRKNMLAELANDVRGTRSYGSAALEIAYIAAGWLDGYITKRLSPWDYAAGLVLLQEVGGMATNMNGDPLSLLHQDSFFAANNCLHEKILNDYLKKQEVEES
ncbi:inositol monophosphatase family protein [Bacillus sp. HMF5848]|uniref:inositol monophosphatase family protein n=1 Tax=Bacillus sp. HMF5848 TaxID=2495421 RepID=UPI000F785F1A|nr:inositol monophosphatase family protein [Bacillus sp. HMF5848]RSK26882.1 inositol monophosphatase family protein [Bacillus sp. HMF5848]